MGAAAGGRAARQYRKAGYRVERTWRGHDFAAFKRRRTTGRAPGRSRRSRAAAQSLRRPSGARKKRTAVGTRQRECSRPGRMPARCSVDGGHSRQARHRLRGAAGFLESRARMPCRRPPPGQDRVDRASPSADLADSSAPPQGGLALFPPCGAARRAAAPAPCSSAIGSRSPPCCLICRAADGRLPRLLAAPTTRRQLSCVSQCRRAARHAPRLPAAKNLALGLGLPASAAAAAGCRPRGRGRLLPPRREPLGQASRGGRVDPAAMA